MYRELKLPSDKPVVKQIKKETYILFMITYLEIGFFFLADDMRQVTSMHTSEHLALTGKDLIGILPDALKLLRSSPSMMILANTMTQERKKTSKLLNPGQPA